MAYKYRYYRYLVTYVGDREQLEAYARRLRRAGYAADKDVCKFEDGDVCILSYPGLQQFGFYSYAGKGANIFQSHQAKEAFSKATESY
jgi:hypothetical protein